MTDVDWPIEDIPDTDYLYYRIHQNQIKHTGGRIVPGCFRERGMATMPEVPASMSTDWSRHSTPLESRGRAAQPEANLIVALPVGTVRAIPAFEVVHAPLTDNQSHTDVFGISRYPKGRDLLVELADVVVPIEDA